jgi:hypothetical protein
MPPPNFSLEMASMDDVTQQEASQPSHSKAKNCAECRRLKIKCDRKVYLNDIYWLLVLKQVSDPLSELHQERVSVDG